MCWHQGAKEIMFLRTYVGALELVSNLKLHNSAISLQLHDLGQLNYYRTQVCQWIDQTTSTPSFHQTEEMNPGMVRVGEGVWAKRMVAWTMNGDSPSAHGLRIVSFKFWSLLRSILFNSKQATVNQIKSSHPFVS